MENPHEILIKSLDKLIETDKAERTALLSVLALYKKRIFREGKTVADENASIYSEKYQKLRVKKFKREDSFKKIFSLTRQLENDIGLLDGILAFGCKNSFNYDKTQWLQDREGIEIFDNLTTSEKKVLMEVLEDELKQRLNS